MQSSRNVPVHWTSRVKFEYNWSNLDFIVPDVQQILNYDVFKLLNIFTVTNISSDQQIAR